jgi:hypothetical protein
MKQLEVGILLKAMRLRAQGFGWTTIAKETGVNNHRIRTAVDPSFKFKRNATARERMSVGKTHRVMQPELVPWDIFAEAERAYSAPRTLTAILMGDPPAGRSALDKK